MVSPAQVEFDRLQNLTSQVAPLLRVTDDPSYEAALELVEIALNRIEAGEASESTHAMADMLLGAIERYENTLPDVQAYEEEIARLDGGLAVLKTLIDQHGLKLHELPEIGDKTQVSRVLKGERKLALKHVKALSLRFGLPVEYFII